MKKRMLTMLLALVMIMAVVPFTAMAAEETCDHHSSYGTLTESVDSDCIHRGAVHILCKRCGEVLRSNYTPLAPHKYGADYKCTVCGTSCNKHDYDAVVTKAATCTEAGSKTQTCKECGYIKTVQTIKALGHKFTDSIEGLAATCTVDGYTAHKECSVCHEKNSDYVVIKAKGHELETIEDVSATCTADGILKQKCKNKNCDYTNEEVRESTGHNLADVSKKDPTCTVAGHTAYRKCTACGSETGKRSIAPTGHTYVNGQCKDCGTAASDYTGPSDTPATSCTHTSTSTYITSSDCTNVGYTVVTCDTCHAEISRDIRPATGHTEKTTVQEPTCTEDGFIKVTCEVCNTQISYILQEHYGHDYVNGICISCGAADSNKYTYDYQDVFLTE